MEDAAEMWRRIAQANVDLSQAVVDNMQQLSQLMGEARSTVQLLADNIQAASAAWDGADAEIEQIFKEIELIIVVDVPEC
ncbi:hypothetical protein [Glycomyces sp. NRRL B-16210]|uniref:hypothetical protein n=1 Tax=Glycomyces sp. NRRL B-16210 TaxID=1463821 RepID=UPI00105C3C3A|nr:hypothetical protein [Glycomyces sp. NRRL B-16210]